MATVASQVKLPSTLGRPLHVDEAETDLTLLAQSIDNILTITLLAEMQISGGAITVSDNLLTAFGKIQNEINNILTITQLSGLSTGTAGVITSSDTLLVALGKLQNEINNILTNTPLTGINTSTTGAIVAGDGILSAFGKTQYQFNNLLNNLLTGFSAVSGTISATDSILTALEKAQYQFNNLLSNVLTGLNTSTTGTVAATDSILVGFGKIQNRLTNILTNTTLTGLVTTAGGILTTADTLISAFGKIEYRLALDDAKVTYPGLPTIAQIGARSSQDFIVGLVPYYVDSTHIGITAGSAYIPSLSGIATLAADTSTAVTSIAAATNYHVYLTSTGTIEIATTAPADPYFGTARAKTSDTTRRYLGTFRTAPAAATLLPFSCAITGGNALEIKEDFGSIVTGVTTDAVTVYSGDFAIPVSGNYVTHLFVSALVTLVAADDTWQSIKLGPYLTATENPGGMTCEDNLTSPAAYAGVYRSQTYKVDRLRGATTLSYSRQTLAGTTGRSLAFACHGVGIVR